MVKVHIIKTKQKLLNSSLSLAALVQSLVQYGVLSIQHGHSCDVDRSELWFELDPWPGNFHTMRVKPKKKKKKKKISEPKTCFVSLFEERGRY